MCWVKTTVIICLINIIMGDESKIIIVGAGAAGIAAASKLYKHGFQNIKILEAENRIGGRVHTTWFDESWVDIGGQWVHGETKNIVFELAWPLGLLEIPQKSEILNIIHNSEGYQIPTSISSNLFKLFSNAKREAYEHLTGNNGSMGEYFTKILTTNATEYSAGNETLAKNLIRLLESYQNSMDSADSWYDSSVRGYLEYWECPGNSKINWKDKGYGTIFDILMKKYPSPENELPVINNTVINSKVVNINYNSIKDQVLVETSNGQKYIADHVIMTPSLGVLKQQYESLFTPELPQSKMKAIKSLSFGTVAKIYLSFEVAWWPNNCNYLLFVWNESNRQEYENDPNKKWLLDLFGFARVPHRPRILCGWMSGPGARYLETLSEHQVLNQVFTILDKFLGKSYNITRPTGILRSNWYSNKNFRGTYSFRSMESEKADVWANDLAIPLLVNDKPIVMFAGEATHMHYYSTVHGAIESGFREANRLIGIYNKSVSV